LWSSRRHAQTDGQVLVVVACRRRRTHVSGCRCCYALRRRRGTGKQSRACGRSGGDDKLSALRRAAADSDTLSPDLLDQIIRAELARGRARRYGARLRRSDDREQLQRLSQTADD